jgi:two-component system, OmpR family, heavy metal sensor histidine kinase CusS
MRSIRRSLLGYFLLLLAVSLGAVGVLVDRFATSAVSEREESETNRIEQAFNVRQKEAKDKFDLALKVESKSFAREVHSHTRTLVGQNPNPTRPGPPPKMPETLTIPPLLKASDDEARVFRTRAALIEFAPGPNLLASLAPAAALEPMLRGNEWRRHHPFPGWVEFEGPRVLARIQESLRKTYTEDHPPYQFQITLVATYPGRNTRNVLTIRSDQLTEDCSPDHTLLEPLTGPVDPPEPTLENIEVPGLGQCRQVSTSVAFGRVIAFSIMLPSPPSPSTPSPALMPPAYAKYPLYPPPTFTFRGPPADLQLRIAVHVVRPYSDLDAQLEKDQAERDNQLAHVREETQDELAQLRSRLILICSGTFIALVLGGWLIVARGLSPLRKLSDAVSQVSEKDFRLPVVPAELGRELAPIHARITQTLTLLQRAFAREKQAVADISHELRTPIASLLATIDVALRKPRTPDQYRSTLEECRLISKQLGQLVERIMTLASLDAGSDHLAVSRTDVAELLAGCAAVIRPLAAANGLSVSVHHSDELALDTDAGKLREVLMNLLHNAVEYNKSGGTIELAARREANWAVFEVRDTGIGMSPEVKEKIFERFYRADASRTATGVHAGLGLAIVKEYVERLHGSIAVESEVGVGTTFRVTLPLVLTTSEPASPPSPLSSTSSDRAKTRDAIAASS